MKEKKKIILIPYPAQGHVTPMLKLAAVIAGLGRFQPVVLTPEFIHRRISPRIHGVLCLPLPDGLDGGTPPPDFFAVERAMEEAMPPALEELLLREMAGGVACVVADLLASWAVEVARRCGVTVAGFWPAMHATYRLVAAIPHLVRTGVISENGCPRNPSDPISLSSQDPILTTNDLPWLIGSSKARVSRFKFWTRTIERSKTLQFLLVNTFSEGSESIMQQSNKFDSQDSPRILEVGPLIMQAATTSGTTFWEEDTSCLDWLDNQNVGSVMYISFGSWVSPIGEAKVRALASALEASRRPFIWVLGPAWHRGLPDGYTTRVAAHGRIVQWAPQLEVLRHPAVRCYLTHCGWNSTMEAIQCKKPLLCYPIAGDQFLNCAYIVNSWKIGVKIERFGIEDIDNGIRKVEDQKFRGRIEELNEKLFGKEGSSKAMANLSTFITEINT
ncbi:UDP-glycosyltransferase 82A1 [Salvia miltiorrhiza]|uniref:UDP-glycosyltransferase 82A1 n=1 Tax=Salvia miltiorrhiza TaxID=226208 RepID=UPI0025ABA568|nr:UDP-glycosyltransferase 82A1 [Salvia miltiorrhiza]